MRKAGVNDKKDGLKRFSLHFCSHYQNLVKYNPEFCGKCPYNGLKRSSKRTATSETCF